MNAVRHSGRPCNVHRFLGEYSSSAPASSISFHALEIRNAVAVHWRFGIRHYDSPAMPWRFIRAIACMPRPYRAPGEPDLSMSFSTNRSGSASAFSSAQAGGVDGAVAASSAGPASSRPAPSPSFQGTHLQYARTDFSRPSSRPTHSPAEVDSLRHMMSAWDGTAKGSVAVSLAGISAEQVSQVKSHYLQTGDVASVFNSIPPGSLSLQLSREQILTAANAYEKTVASNLADPSPSHDALRFFSQLARAVSLVRRGDRRLRRRRMGHVPV